MYVLASVGAHMLVMIFVQLDHQIELVSVFKLRRHNVDKAKTPPQLAPESDGDEIFYNLRVYAEPQEILHQTKISFDRYFQVSH